jgi:hypothetical protein
MAVGVGVTHASFGREVQSEPPQLVRIIGLFCTSARTETQDAEGEEPRHLVEAVGRGHRHGPEAVRHGRRSKRHFVTALACQDTIGWMQIQIKQALTEVERKQK